MDASTRFCCGRFLRPQTEGNCQEDLLRAEDVRCWRLLEGVEGGNVFYVSRSTATVYRALSIDDNFLESMLTLFTG